MNKSKLKKWDTIRVLSHFASGYVNGDMSGYEDSDIPHVDNLSRKYPFSEYILDWRFDNGTQFIKCDISKVYGDCVDIDIYVINN